MEIKEKLGFIINPKSGTRTKENIPQLIEDIIDHNRFEISIKFTQCAGHGIQLAQVMAKEGYSIVVAVGGDGTVNEVAQSLVNTNSALAIIPCGSGNGLARHLEIPLNIRDAIKLINNCKIVEIDHGTANDIKFFCTCGVGFDAHIGNEFAKQKTRGFFTYLKSILGEFMKYKPKKYKLKTKEGKITKRAFLVTFANGSQYGNNAFIAPLADIQDGKIDVCILQPFPVYKAIEIGRRLMSKKINDCQYVEILQTDEIRIKRKRKDVFHFDGEPCMMKKKIIIRSHKGGLKVGVSTSSKLK